MIYRLDVPELGQDAGEIRVLEWHGDVGAAFDVGDMIVELETHKAVVEIRAGQQGVFRNIAVAAGEWCESGAPLALFGDTADEALPDQAKDANTLIVQFEIA